jgi:hypothetical protein
MEKEFFEGSFEILLGWIKEDLLVGVKGQEELRDFYNVTIGPDKRPLTEEEFFFTYKSAEIVCKDDIAFKQKKKNNQMFRRK